MDNNRNDIKRYENQRGGLLRPEIPVAEYEFGPRQEINLKEYWEKIRRRKTTVFSVAAVVFVLTALWTFVQRPVYTAKGTLLIEKEPNILSFEQVFQIETMRDDFYQTQYRLLSGRTLADDVISRLKLYANEEFVGKPDKRKKPADPNDHVFRENLIDSFSRRLQVKPVRLTRLVEVSFDARDPKLAAECVNELASAFIDLNITMKYAATEQATEFLGQQIKSLQTDIEQKSGQLQDLEAKANIVALGEKETTVIDRLGELNKALTEAQIDRYKKEATYNELKNVTADFVPEAINNLLIQRLREDYVKLKREYQKMEERFQPDYPELQRARVEMEAARKSLEDETQNLVKGAYSDYQTALRREGSLEAAFNEQKNAAFKMNSSAVLYNGLKIEVQNKKTLLDSLLRRESETGVEARLRGLRTSNVRVVDRAGIPVRPSSPRKARNLALALLLGLGGGIGLAFLFDFLDNSIKTSEDVERYAGLPTLGVVPKFSLDGTEKGYLYYRRKREHRLEGKKDGVIQLEAGEGQAGEKKAEEQKQDKPQPRVIELIPHLFPNSRLAESYRSIRTSLLLSSADQLLKTMIVTSALPGEGKTVSVANLGITLAQSGKAVLIVDADLRRPRQHRVFSVKNTFGLTSYLTDSIELRKVVKTTAVPNLCLINSGPVPPNPAELLGSEKMAALIELLRDKCDYILFDMPPMLEISDALILGAKVDGMILVVHGDKTSREALRKAREKLDMLKVKTLGVIINNVNTDHRGYHYKEYYYHYDRHA
ncbi:MAG: polysaccharide biosynthesis tyrosine autokinase [Candidatus Aminicenantales bacterium]